MLSFNNNVILWNRENIIFINPALCSHKAWRGSAVVSMAVAEHLLLTCHLSGLASMEMPFSLLISLVVGSSRELLPGPPLFPVCSGTSRSRRLSAAWMPSLCNIRDRCTIPHAILGWVGTLRGCLRPMCLDIAPTLLYTG